MTSKSATTKKKELQLSLELDGRGQVSEGPVPWNPEPWQLESVSWLIEHCAAGLLLDPGMRKTSATLAAFKVLKREKICERMLVIAPKRPMQMVWPAEQSKWKDFSDLDLVVLHGKRKEEIIYEDHDIFVTNYESIPWLLQDKRYQQIGAEILVCDELSKLKHTNTQRFKLLKPILRYFKRRWGLTGSPTPNGYLDLFGQCYTLDLGNALGPYITHYRNRFFYPSGFGGYDWKIRDGADKEIQQAIKPLMMRMEAEDYIKLPKLVPNIIRVDLPDDARQMYEEMEDEMLVYFQDEEITAINAAVCSNKCSQIANGGLYLENKYNGEKRRAIEIHEAKNEALRDLIDELQGSPLLIGYEFNHDLERIRKLLGKDMPVIGKGTSDKRAAELEKMWNRKELPYLAGHPASIGHGLNLQDAGNHLCFYSTPWDFELVDQFTRRVRRSGNNHTMVFAHYIIARDTVDEAKLSATRRKGDTQKRFMDAMKAYKKEVGKRRQLPVFTKTEFEKITAINDEEIPF